MSDKYIEKTFLYFIALSLLLHVAAITVYLLLPQEKKTFKTAPFMVDLSDLPELKNLPKSEEKTHRLADKRRRVMRETAPKGEGARDRVTSSRLADKGIIVPGAPPKARRSGAPPLSREDLSEDVKRSGQAAKPKESALPQLAKLYPSANKLARLEESYRKKYDTEVEEGDTKFLNSDDIRFGSFLRRFETAVYGVWRYPTEAARAGVQGVTPVKITFNRKGEIESIQLLQSSGSKLLDDEVFRTLHALGPLGGLPKGYDKDHFNLIAFFEYGIINGISRGLR